MQIRFMLLQNRQGKTRLSKWYVPYDDSEKQAIQVECHKVVTQREAKFTNFVEWRTHKLVYRYLC
jgi:AP-2 complex subunit sigma-1